MAVCVVAGAARLAIPRSLSATPSGLDFGRIGEGRVVSGRVILTNAENKPLSIQTVAASCGCTTPGQVTAIPANGSVSLPISFNSSGRPGLIRQNVLVVTNEHPNSPLIVSITGNVIPVVRVMPEMMALGFIRSREQKPFAVTVTRMDSKPLSVSGVKTSRRVQAHMKSGGTSAEVRVWGTVTAPDAAGEYQENLVLKLNESLLPEVTVPLQFTVPSEFKIAPQSINFGMVQSGGTPAKKIRIEGDFRGRLHVVEAPAVLAVSLRRESASVYWMQAQILAGEHHGLLSNRVVVATGNVRQPEIIIPAYAAFAPR